MNPLKWLLSLFWQPRTYCPDCGAELEDDQVACGREQWEPEPYTGICEVCHEPVHGWQVSAGFDCDSNEVFHYDCLPPEMKAQAEPAELLDEDDEPPPWHEASLCSDCQEACGNTCNCWCHGVKEAT